MTKRQMLWASQHDWFIVDLGDGRALVAEHWLQVSTDPNGITSVGARGADWRTFNTVQGLRAWAGY